MQTDCFPAARCKWPKAPISRLATVNPRYNVAAGVRYPFLDMAAVREDFGGITSFSEREADASGLSRFKLGDTLFAKITPCPENGKIAFVSDLPGSLGLGSTEFIVLSPREGTDPRFLYHLLCAHTVRGHAVARMEGSTGRQRVPDEVFRKRLLVPIPPLDEQAAIARVLDTAEHAALSVKTAAAEVQVLKRALMQDLLPHWVGLRHSDADGQGGVESVARADVVTRVGNGSTPSRMDRRYWRDGTVPWLATGKVHDRVIDRADEYVTEAALRECSIRLLSAGTVLVAMIGQGRTRGMAAYLGIEACINQNFGAFTPYISPERRVSGKWLFYFFDHHYARLRELGGGTNQGALSCYLLKRLRVPLPSVSHQERVARLLEAVDVLERSYRELWIDLIFVRKRMAQDLLTGRMRAPRDLQLSAAQ